MSGCFRNIRIFYFGTLLSQLILTTPHWRKKHTFSCLNNVQNQYSVYRFLHGAVEARWHFFPWGIILCGSTESEHFLFSRIHSTGVLKPSEVHAPPSRPGMSGSNKLRGQQTTLKAASLYLFLCSEHDIHFFV